MERTEAAEKVAEKGWLWDNRDNFIGNKLDEVVGKNHRKIRMDRNNTVVHKPLCFYDTEVLDDEMNKTVFEDYSKQPLEGFTRRLNMKTGEVIWDRCQVITKIDRGRYAVMLPESSRVKLVDRLNLRLEDDESTHDADKRRQDAESKRHIEEYRNNLKCNHSCH